MKIYKSFGIRINKVFFFIKNKKDCNMNYKLIDKYFRFDEIESSLFLIEMKLKSLILKEVKPNLQLKEKRFFLEVIGKDHLITTKNIKFPPNIELASEHKDIGFISSNDLDLKILMFVCS